MVAACNPHRGNSVASHKQWLNTTYFVHPLHPTLKLLRWDYGALDSHQEFYYIQAKMEVMDSMEERADVS